MHFSRNCVVVVSGPLAVNTCVFGCVQGEQCQGLSVKMWKSEFVIHMHQWSDSQSGVFSICLILSVKLEVHSGCLFPSPLIRARRSQPALSMQEISLSKTASLRKISPPVTSLGQVVSPCATIHSIFQQNTVNISSNCIPPHPPEIHSQSL